MTNKLDEIYQEYWQFNSKMLDDYKPMEVAGVMMAQAMTLYKTMLSEEDFSQLMETIFITHKKDVKPLDIPTLQ